MWLVTVILTSHQSSVHLRIQISIPDKNYLKKVFTEVGQANGRIACASNVRKPENSIGTEALKNLAWTHRDVNLCWSDSLMTFSDPI